MTKVLAFGSMARYACDLAAGESANAAASALSEKLVDPGRDVGAVVGTHLAADDAVVAECRPRGEATFAGRGNVDVLVVVFHREMCPVGIPAFATALVLSDTAPMRSLAAFPGAILLADKVLPAGAGPPMMRSLPSTVFSFGS